MAARFVNSLHIYYWQFTLQFSNHHTRARTITFWVRLHCTFIIGTFIIAHLLLAIGNLRWALKVSQVGNSLHIYWQVGNSLQNIYWQVGNSLHIYCQVGNSLHIYWQVGNSLQIYWEVGNSLHLDWQVGNRFAFTGKLNIDRQVSNAFHICWQVGNSFDIYRQIGNSFHNYWALHNPFEHWREVTSMQPPQSLCHTNELHFLKRWPYSACISAIHRTLASKGPISLIWSSANCPHNLLGTFWRSCEISLLH